MGSNWSQDVRDRAVADLASGMTVPAVSKAYGVPVGTLRGWKRKDRPRTKAPVVDMSGAPVTDDPVSLMLLAMTSDNPEEAIKAQMRALLIEKMQATEIGQFGAAATMQSHIAKLREELRAHRAEKPVADPLDIPEDEYIDGLHKLALEMPTPYLEVLVEVYLERMGVTLVEASRAGR